MGGIVFGAFENDANKAAHIAAQLFRLTVNPCARNDPGLLPFSSMNVVVLVVANAKLFGQFGVGGAAFSIKASSMPRSRLSIPYTFPSLFLMLINIIPILAIIFNESKIEVGFYLLIIE